MPQRPLWLQLDSFSPSGLQGAYPCQTRNTKVVGLQSQARLLHQPCIRPLQLLQTGKLETKQKVISNTVKFRHAYLQIPTVSADTRIINRLQVMASSLRNSPLPTSSNQLDAIEMLRTLFEKWKLLAPPALLNESHAVCLPCASLPQAPAFPVQHQHQILSTTLFTPANKMTTTMMHLVPPHGYYPCYRHQCRIRQYNAHMSPLSNRPHPRVLSLTTVLLQGCPKKPHNCR